MYRGYSLVILLTGSFVNGGLQRMVGGRGGLGCDWCPQKLYRGGVNMRR